MRNPWNCDHVTIFQGEGTRFPIEQRTYKVCKNRVRIVKNFNDNCMINLLFAHAKTHDILEKNHEHTWELYWRVCVFQIDRAITKVIIYHRYNRQPRVVARNITRENLRYIAPILWHREREKEREKKREEKKREKRQDQSDCVSWPSCCLSFAPVGGKRLIMCSKVRDFVVLGDPSPL